MEHVIGRRARVAEVRVKLQPELLQQFDQIAQRRGVPAATLAALVIGEYVEKQGEAASLQRLVALDTSKRISDKFSEEDLLKGFSAMDPEVLRTMFSAFAETQEAGQAGSSAGPEAAACSAAQAAGQDRVRTAT